MRCAGCAAVARVGELHVGGLRWPPAPGWSSLTESSSGGWASRCGPVNEVGRAVRGDGIAVGEQFTGVLEDHDAVAQQAPALFRVSDKSPSRFVFPDTISVSGGSMRA